MIRFAVRASLLTFGVIALLIGGVLAVSGAFRPARFVTAKVINGERFDMQLNAFSLDGRMSPFSRSGPAIIWDLIPINRVSWMFYDEPSKLHIWENGRLTVIEEASLDVLWSNDGRAAWWRTEQENNLRIWDGESVHQITTSAELLFSIAWTDDNQLWWVQKSWNGSWELMLWHDQGIEVLYSSVEPLFTASFFPCGAALLNRSDGAYIYQLRERTLLPVPPSLNTMDRAFATDTCHTFLVSSTSIDSSEPDVAQIWDGTTQTILSSHTYIIQGDHQLLGAEKAETTPDQWTLIYSEQGERHQQVVQSVWPVFVGWDEATSFWVLPQPDETAVMLVWQMGKNQTEAYPFAPLSDASFRLDTVNHLAVWMESIDPTMLHLGLWDNTAMTRRVLTLTEGQTAVRLGETRWMNDGNLLLTLFPDVPSQPDLPGSLYIYHWDEDRVERIGTIPANTYGFSDWITWE